jgi:hypothetical protein
MQLIANVKYQILQGRNGQENDLTRRRRFGAILFAIKNK